MLGQIYVMVGDHYLKSIVESFQTSLKNRRKLYIFLFLKSPFGYNQTKKLPHLASVLILMWFFFGVWKVPTFFNVSDSSGNFDIILS